MQLLKSFKHNCATRPHCHTQTELLIGKTTPDVTSGFRSVVVITCASHAQGRRFEPGRKQGQYLFGWYLFGWYLFFLVFELHHLFTVTSRKKSLPQSLLYLPQRVAYEILFVYNIYTVEWRYTKIYKLNVSIEIKILVQRLVIMKLCQPNWFTQDCPIILTSTTLKSMKK